jgi:exodeoxyribonuclease VII small subunit
MTSFKEAYGVLSRHAQTLRNQQEPNIDDLLSIVTESVDAYKVCKQRIDAVEAALEKALADPEVVASGAPQERRSTPAVHPPATASTFQNTTPAPPDGDGADDVFPS